METTEGIRTTENSSAGLATCLRFRLNVNGTRGSQTRYRLMAGWLLRGYCKSWKGTSAYLDDRKNSDSLVGRTVLSNRASVVLLVCFQRHLRLETKPSAGAS